MRHFRIFISANNGMTLTELIMAAILVGVVAVGALSVDYALRSARNNVHSDSMLTSSTTNVMERIRRDAAAASGSSADPGVLTNATYLCLRIDNRDFNNAADDLWACYSQNGTNLYRCLFDSFAPGACAVDNDNLIGTAVAGGFTYTFVMSATDLYLDVTLINRFPNPGSAANPITNPEYRLDSRVYPDSHSF